MHYSQVYHSTLPSDELVQQVRQMPKVEVHVHLEGATSPERIFAMAARNHVRLGAETVREWQTFYEFRNFDHFIEVYLLSVACMQTPRDFAEMVVDFMSRQAAQNIQYTEVFVSSALHLQRISGDEILAALEEGVRTGRERYGVEIAFIPDLSRQSCVEPKTQAEVLNFALKAKERGIAIGLGIGGFEIGYPAEIYRETFAEARRQGLHVVAHAGETGDPGIVREAVDVLKAERIGHGIRALEDPALVCELCARHIPIEVSPQSNYCTRVVGTDEPHPIRRMLEAGLNCTLNSDDPSMFSTDLDNEYLTLAAQGFSFAELWQLNLNGLQATFMEAGKKAELCRKWGGQG